MAEENTHRAQVDELLADYRRSRAQLASVHQQMAAIRQTARTPDGSVSATVGARGTLTELTISEQAYQRYRPTELAKVIVELTGQAGARALREASDALAPVLPAGTDPEALLLGTADLDATEIAPDRSKGSGKPADSTEDGEDSFAERSWLDDADAAANRR
ncbi:YbaB/EbfC DNA-binding family protein [Tamaricihabitans halophyticus]|uniref:YbaB/EbfC DNA-binding family protein n=1 Tax=Tamaricihabitans halophyticus TaxID=1262583 RepID=A0A4V2SUZ6_9PSEU|nr:YbaB/EbfC DNA-binding family protein [Tamaricihabitans halophyticus]